MPRQRRVSGARGMSVRHSRTRPTTLELKWRQNPKRASNCTLAQWQRAAFWQLSLSGARTKHFSATDGREFRERRIGHELRAEFSGSGTNNFTWSRETNSRE